MRPAPGQARGLDFGNQEADGILLSWRLPSLSQPSSPRRQTWLLLGSGDGRLQARPGNPGPEARSPVSRTLPGWTSRGGPGGSAWTWWPLWSTWWKQAGPFPEWGQGPLQTNDQVDVLPLSVYAFLHSLLCLIFLYYFCIILMRVQLIYNAVLVSGVQQSQSVTHIHILFLRFFSHRGH